MWSYLKHTIYLMLLNKNDWLLLLFGLCWQLVITLSVWPGNTKLTLDICGLAQSDHIKLLQLNS